MPITTDSIREIIDDFQKVIIEKRISSASPEETVINFRNEESQNKTRRIFLVPLELLPLPQRERTNCFLCTRPRTKNRHA